jgi:cell division protein FtsB
MEFGGPIFVIAIVAISTIGWVMTTAIRARHGYPLTDDWGKAVSPTNREADQATKALTAENEQLKTTVGRLEERLKVLERIATDPSRQLADEIEKLR